MQLSELDSLFFTMSLLFGDDTTIILCQEDRPGTDTFQDSAQSHGLLVKVGKLATLGEGGPLSEVIQGFTVHSGLSFRKIDLMPYCPVARRVPASRLEIGRYPHLCHKEEARRIECTYIYIDCGVDSTHFPFKL